MNAKKRGRGKGLYASALSNIRMPGTMYTLESYDRLSPIVHLQPKVSSYLLFTDLNSSNVEDL